MIPGDLVAIREWALTITAVIMAVVLLVIMAGVIAGVIAAIRRNRIQRLREREIVLRYVAEKQASGQWPPDDL